MLSFALMLMAVTGAPASAQWTTNVYGPHVFLGTSETTHVPESSGVVAGRRNCDVFWTHNDSGHPHPRIWAFRLSAADKADRKAKHLGYVELRGASNVDWEDIAAGPGHSIYVLDGGDNPPCERIDKHIHRFIEPALDPDGAPVARTTRFDSIRFEYPDARKPSSPAEADGQRYDAECLFVHPVTGDMYVVTKRNSRGAAAARVYKLPAAGITWNSQRCHVLTFVADLSSPVLNMITAGDVDPAGRRVVLRNYLVSFEFTLPAGQPFDMIFRQRPRTRSLALEAVQLLQGEGICYAHNGRDLVTTTESRRGRNDRRFRIFSSPWRLANLRVESVGSESAVVCWDTAQPLDSTVEYGHGTDRGQSVSDKVKTVSDKTNVTSHTVRLTDLKPGTRYHYRVKSGPLIYPASAPAPDASFLTKPPRPPLPNRNS